MHLVLKDRCSIYSEKSSDMISVYLYYSIWRYLCLCIQLGVWQVYRHWYSWRRICGGSALDGSVPPQAVTSLDSGASCCPMNTRHVIACLCSSATVETASHVTSLRMIQHSPRVEWPLQTKFNILTRKDTTLKPA